MDLEPKTQARILKLFEHKICSACGSPAKRFLKKKPYCQKCFLVRKIQDTDEPSEPHVYPDPFPEPSPTEEEEMSRFVHQRH
jgi:hypothetical protein